MDKRDVIIPTPEEDAQINRGIAQDPDNPEWTDEDFADADLYEGGGLVRRGAGSSTEEAVTEAMRRFRGPQKTPTKAMISLRLDRDVLERLRESGPGWQGRLNDMLRRAVLGDAA